MGSVDIRVVRNELKFPIRSLQNLAFYNAKRKFEAKKRAMIEAFKNHPVTVEIEGGPDSSNNSGTTDGYGNIFSFIGFDAGTNPLDVVFESLERDTQVTERVKISSTGDITIFSFDVEAPSLEDLGALTPYPYGWNSGSWLVDIEYGIPGLRYYLYKKGEEIAASHSGPAIQVGSVVRGNESFHRIKYLSEIFKAFFESLQLE